MDLILFAMALGLRKSDLPMATKRDTTPKQSEAELDRHGERRDPN